MTIIKSLRCECGTVFNPSTSPDRYHQGAAQLGSVLLHLAHFHELRGTLTNDLGTVRIEEPGDGMIVTDVIQRKTVLLRNVE